MDPVSIGIVGASCIALGLIGKSWSAQKWASRIEVAKLRAQRRNDDMDKDLSLALQEADEAKRFAAAARELCERFDSRLHAVENRTRR